MEKRRGFFKCSFIVCRACAAPAPTKGQLSSEERERERRLHGQGPLRGSARLPNLNVIFTPVRRMKGAAGWRRGVSHFDGAVSEKVAGMAPPPSGRPASGWLFAGCYAKRAAWGQFFMAAPILRQPASRGSGGVCVRMEDRDTGSRTIPSCVKITDGCHYLEGSLKPSSIFWPMKCTNVERAN